MSDDQRMKHYARQLLEFIVNFEKLCVVTVAAKSKNQLESKVRRNGGPDRILPKRDGRVTENSFGTALAVNPTFSLVKLQEICEM